MAPLNCGVCGADLGLGDLLCRGCGTPAAAARQRARTPRELAVDEAERTVAPVREEGERCPAEDCGAPLPEAAERCPYCGRLQEERDAGAAAPSDPASGASPLPPDLAVRFTVHRELPAEGAEADLFFVDDRRTGERSVLKLYRAGVEVDAAALEQLAQADIAHVVRIEAHGRIGNRAYEVLEHIPAGDLSVFQQRHGPSIEPGVVRTILQELADAVEHLHDVLGLRHGDVKPANILVRTEDPLDLVLADFGLAAVTDATLVFGGQGHRSRMYASPEQVAGAAGLPPDIWALGVVVMELLLGHHPLAELATGTIDYHLVSQPWPINPDLVEDPSWQRFLSGTLHRDPVRRWTVGDVQDWLAGHPTPEVADPAAAGGSTQVFELEGRHYTSLKGVATALVSRWEVGRSRVAHGAVQRWVRARGDDPQLAAWFEELEGQRWDEHGRLVRVALRLHPELPPVYRGYDISLEGLRGLAAEAVRDGEDSPASQVARSLLEQDVIGAVASLTGSPEHHRLAEDLEVQLPRLEELLRMVAAEAFATEDVTRLARPRLLQLCVDEDERRRVERAVRRQRRRYLPGWYRRLLDDGAGTAALVVALAFREPVQQWARETREDQQRAALQERARGRDAVSWLSRRVRIGVGALAAGLALLAPFPTALALLLYAAGSRYSADLRRWFETERERTWPAGRILSLPLLAVRWLLVVAGSLLRDLLIIALAGGVWVALVLLTAGAAHELLQPAMEMEDLLRRLVIPALAFQAGYWLAQDRRPEGAYRTAALVSRSLRLAPAGVLLTLWLVAGGGLYLGWMNGPDDALDRIEPVALDALAGFGDRLDAVFATQDAAPTQPRSGVDDDPPAANGGETWKVRGVIELNVRDAPGLDSSVIATLREGQTRLGTGRSETADGIEWLELELPGGVAGWASSRYLVPED